VIGTTVPRIEDDPAVGEVMVADKTTTETAGEVAVAALL
jgi:hypothetical protein